MKPQHYSNPYFDRATWLRKETASISQNDFLIISVEEKFYFSHSNGEPEPFLFPLQLFKAFSREITFLGRVEDKNLWTLQLPSSGLMDLQVLPSDGEFFNIRELVGLLNREQAAYLSYALGIHRWHTVSRFCGACGAPTESRENGHVRRCTSPACATLFFPQISPAVIVLIEYRPEGDEPLCLLSKGRTSDGLVCSTFAGFVEVGESLEEAVVREMQEEVNLNVGRIRYVSSQPWPFSSSLMAGFVAEAATMEFKVDGEEIKDAGWFTATELRKLVAADKIMLSRPDSIARYLIESWIWNN
ncbi:NADH pyrophosphatase [Fulvivirga imtechensis AK7]|uniref:NAD(+) diphosphatase n=1 Tax=Fulvivirga imtechensis AK7 TaxID=1237149 RepID=L8JUY2_9BACT|nr:NAD(+) diphosphatase [Fulvivirga imtechensis]ELR72605.1 NADH pyrophosphatase [Fulvivirga imtechensis AK7]